MNGLLVAVALLYVAVMVVPWSMKLLGLPGSDQLISLMHRLMLLPFRLVAAAWRRRR